MVGPGILYPDVWMEWQSKPHQDTDLGWTAWEGSMMNTWDPEQVRGLYEKQSCGYIPAIDG